MPRDKGARNQKKKLEWDVLLCRPPPAPQTLFITLNTDVSADLSCADVTEGGELQQEVVVWEGHLGVGYAAVVTCGSGKTRQPGSYWRRQALGPRRHVHSHELWSRKSPEPSQFRKSPVSARKNRRVQPFCQGCIAAVGFFPSLFFMQQLKRRASGFAATNAHNDRRWLAQCDRYKSARR